MLWLNRQDLTGTALHRVSHLQKKWPLVSALPFDGFFLNFAKIQVFNCQLSSFFIEDLCWQLDKTVVPEFYSVFDQETLFTNLGFTRPLLHFTPVKCKAHWLLAFQKYTMLYVVINLLIWFWERCIEIHFRTCAGSPPSIQIYILLSCIEMC